MWRKIRKNLKRSLNVLVWVLAVLLVVDLYFELVGVSGRCLWNRLGLPKDSIQSGRIRFGIFRDLSIPDVRVKIDTPYGPLKGEFRQIQVNPHWRSLLRGRVQLEEFHVKDGNMVLGNNGLIWLGRANCNGYIQEDYKHGDVKLDGLFNGIAVQIQVSLQNVDLLPRVFDGQRKSNFSKDFYKKLIQSFGEWSKTNIMGTGDVRVILRIEMDCKDYTSTRVQGALNVNDGIFCGVIIEKLYARFSGADSVFRLHTLEWHQYGGDVLRMSGSYNTERKLASAHWQAVLCPERVLALLGKSVEHEGLQRCMPRQVKIQGELIESPLSLRGMKLQCNVEANDCRFTQRGLSNVTGRARLEDGVLHLDPFRLTIEGHANEYIEGKGSIDLSTHRMNLEADGVWNWSNALGITLPRWVQLGTPHEAQVHVSIKDSLPGMDQLRMNVDFTQKELRLWSGVLTDVRGRFRWDAYKLYLEELSACWGDSKHRAIRLKAQIDMTNHWQTMCDRGLNGLDQMKVIWHAEVDGLAQERKDGKVVAPTKAKGETEERWLPGLTGTGTLNLSFLMQQMDFDGKVSLFFDRINQTYLSQWRYDDYEDVALIYCTDSPFEISFSQAPMNISGEDLHVVGNASVRNGGFGAFQAKSASCHFEVTNDYARVTEINGISRDDEPLSLEMEVVYHPFVWTMTNLKFKGDPKNIAPFITNEKGASVYRQIWQSFNWNKKELPLIKIPRLVYSSDDMDSVWELQLDGNLEATNVKYDKLEPGDVAMDVHLKLPGALNLRNIRLKSNSVDAKGSFDMRFEGSTACLLRIDECKGALNLYSILSEVDPSWGKVANELVFHKDSVLSCHGEFLLGDEHNMAFVGTIKSPECIYFGYKVQELEGNWRYENRCVAWNIRKGTFAKGKCLLTGYLDFIRREGELLLNVDDMEGTEFFQYFTDELAEKNVVPGKIDLELNALYRLGWAGHAYYVTGDGKISMQDGDFWQVPMMKGLGKFLTMSTFNLFGSVQLGRITALQADLEFKGTRIKVSNLTTDGTLVAVTGEGEYDWEKDELYCVFAGEAMRNMGIVSWLFKPLSWAFDVEVKGKNHKYEWRTRTGLRKLLIGD